MDDSILGTRVDDYRIEAVLGKGGMGTVYKARDVNLSRPVALKRINPSQAHRETFIHRFRSEAKALARIDSRHITSVHALRETDIGLLIVMEFVEGGTLNDAIREAGGPLPVESAIQILEQILTAFQDAHSAGVIHRDIKPQNIMLSDDGRVKVMDFGIAKLRRPDSGETVTQGGRGGTLTYMAPEQVSSLEEVDNRSDLYAIGMTAYEMLTGTLPFEEAMTDFDIMQAVVEGDIPPPTTYASSLPAALSEWVETALALDQDDRFQSAGAMMQDLVAVREETNEKSGGAAGAGVASAADPAGGGGTQTALDPTPPGASADADAPASSQRPDERPDKRPGRRSRPGTPGSEADQGTADQGETGERGENENGRGTAQLVGITGAVVLLIAAGTWMLPWMFPGRSGSSASPAQLSLSTTPADAVVTVNGEKVGRTPLSGVAVPTGRLAIRVTKSGYEAVDTSMQQVAAGADVSMSGLRLSPAAGASGSPPSGASRSQTASAANSPGSPEDPPSGRRSSAERPPAERPPAETRSAESSQEEPSQEEPSGGEAAEAEASGGEPSAAASARLAVQGGTPAATLDVDGVAVSAGETRRLPAGSHPVVCRHPQHDDLRAEVTLPADQTRTIGCFFEQPVSVNMIGAWGNVVVNGENTRTPAPTTLRLPPGEHTIGLSVKRNAALQVEGGQYRRQVGGETEASGSFSGGTHTIRVEPSLRPVEHAVVFQVNE